MIVIAVVLLLIAAVLAIKLKRANEKVELLTRRNAGHEIVEREYLAQIDDLNTKLNDAHSNLELVIASTDKQLLDAHTSIELLLQPKHVS